jgi:transcriptional regulator with XRE-family HTH domain
MATLAEIRKSKQLTTVDIAVQLGISQGYYSNLERGKRPFNDALLKKTAKALRVPLHTTREAVKSNPQEPHTLKSWMSSIKINGLPLIKAFHYYLETHEIKAQSLDDAKLKKEMKEFIEANIGFSILAELSENKALLNHVREIIGTYSTLLKNTMPNNGSKKIH